MKFFIGGKCSDCSYHSVIDDSGNRIVDNDGYVPYIPGIGGGDYLELEIDVNTGSIIGWKPEEFKEWVNGNHTE